MLEELANGGRLEVIGELRGERGKRVLNEAGKLSERDAQLRRALCLEKPAQGVTSLGNESIPPASIRCCRIDVPGAPRRRTMSWTIC